MSSSSCVHVLVYVLGPILVWFLVVLLVLGLVPAYILVLILALILVVVMVMVTKPAGNTVTLNQDLRIVLVGKTGVGKSAVGNTILRRRVFESAVRSSSVTSVCKKETTEFGGCTLDVIDTPGLYDTNCTNDQVKREIARCISFAAPGPHVFLVVIQPNRFTKEEQETVKIIQKMFGEESGQYTMVLFTHGDLLKEEDASIETLISMSEPLSDFIRQCGGGYHVFDNKDKSLTQVSELVKKINRMVQRNGGRYYTQEMFEAAERAIEEEMKRLQRENPHMNPRDARRMTEEDNWFIRAIVGGAAAGAGVGAAVGSVFGGVGAAPGAGVGAVVGGASRAIMAVKEKACVIQ